MEKIISEEEKIRRAIEISQRRNNNYYKTTTTRVNVNEKKDYTLFKKMILQIIICLLIYIIFYLITSTNYVFSAQVIESTNQILNYDMNFSEMYNNLMQFFNTNINLNQEQVENTNTLENINTITQNEEITENNLAVDSQITETNEIVEEQNTTVEEKKEVEKNNVTEEEKKEETENIAVKEEKTQMELDAEEAMKICKFAKPLSGTITSEFGEREVISDVMSADHKGIDIAANSGTSIKAAMSGTVRVAEENSEYGKFIKIVNEDVMTVYAHCQKLKVKVGDKVKIGQIIATVGSTGNSTGPHLHFEVRLENRYINPRNVIDF